MRGVDPGRQRGFRVSDRGLHGPAEALLSHGGAELTGERSAAPVMMAGRAGVGERRLMLDGVGSSLRESLTC